MYTHTIVNSWRDIQFFVGRRSKCSGQLVLFSGRFGFNLTFERGGDDALSMSLSLVLFSLYLGFNTQWLSKLSDLLLRGSYEPHSVGVRIHGWGVWWDLWHSTHSWSSKTPKWRQGGWYPIDTLFGRMKHSEREISTTQTAIRMAEGSYPCTVTMKEETWKRPRLPWRSHKGIRAHIDCPKGVPHPGKGENSWDCGEDATFGLTTTAATVEEGIAKFIESVLRNRRRHGGSVNWQPSAPQPPGERP